MATRVVNQHRVDIALADPAFQQRRHHLAADMMIAVIGQQLMAQLVGRQIVGPAGAIVRQGDPVGIAAFRQCDDGSDTFSSIGDEIYAEPVHAEDRALIGDPHQIVEIGRIARMPDDDIAQIDALFGERAGLWCAVALNLALFFTFSSAAWVLPDGPLLLWSAAAALCLARAVLHPPPERRQVPR